MIQLTLDHTAGATTRTQLSEAEAQLAEDVRLHAHGWFVDRKDQTLRPIRQLFEDVGVDADTVQLVGELLLAELDGPDLLTRWLQIYPVNDLGIEGLEPVTNQVTTMLGKDRRSATHPDTKIPPICGNSTHPHTTDGTGLHGKEKVYS